MLGSWAGAMGQTQFMPSSYLKYAVDFDGDGSATSGPTPPTPSARPPIPAEHGWKRGAPWGFEVALPDGFELTLEDTDNSTPSGEFARRGVQARRRRPDAVLRRGQADDPGGL